MSVTTLDHILRGWTTMTRGANKRHVVDVGEVCTRDVEGGGEDIQYCVVCETYTVDGTGSESNGSNSASRSGDRHTWVGAAVSQNDRNLVNSLDGIAFREGVVVATTGVVDLAQLADLLCLWRSFFLPPPPSERILRQCLCPHKPL